MIFVVHFLADSFSASTFPVPFQI